MSQIVWVSSDLAAADSLPSNPGRASLVYSLAKSFNLFECQEFNKENCARVYAAPLATKNDLLKFHDANYVEALYDEAEGDVFGLEDDCPRFPNMWKYCLSIAGASLSAADILRKSKAKTVLVWQGGRHHARRTRASGFCYVQDIVLCIQKLREKVPLNPEIPERQFKRVLYVDLDIHHGDGVESAFLSTTSVVTISLHLFRPGFFPGTGGDIIGPAHKSFNIPLLPGLSSAGLKELFECISLTRDSFKPDVLVVQCGCDGLAGDEIGEWNVDLKGFGDIVQQILLWDLPTILMGGGGYSSPNAARCWTYLTSIAIGEALPLDSDIPVAFEDEQDSYGVFAPSFTLDVPAGNRPDMNTKESLSRIIETFRKTL